MFFPAYGQNDAKWRKRREDVGNKLRDYNGRMLQTYHVQDYTLINDSKS